MKISIFAKKKKTSTGKEFYTYLGKLTKKSGETVTAVIKFNEECGAPKPAVCPCIIELNKTDCNFSEKVKHLTDGRDIVEKTLWVNAWKKSDEEYVDTSMDDFE